MQPIIKGKSWKKIPPETETKIKNVLLKHPEVSKHPPRSPYEKWKFKFLDAFITFYTTGTLYVSASKFPRTQKLLEYFDALIPSRFSSGSKEIYVGCDEAGKGEILGSIVLACVKFPEKQYEKLVKILGNADTKTKRSLEYWEELFDKISDVPEVNFQVEFIAPEELKPKQTHKIMDEKYLRLLRKISLVPEKTRLVIDDYGAGKPLKTYLEKLRDQGAEVILTSKADDNFLEAKAASVVAKFFKEKHFEQIRYEAEKLLPGVPIGSGNAGDKKTVAWLKEYYKKYRSWAPFVKTYFKTVSDIEAKFS